jgi:transcriptional regulator with XRE-family HTH domain
MTQQQLADALGIGQDGISRLEQRQDLRVSTLRAYVEALGGRLTLFADFPEQPSIVIAGFDRPK